MSSAPLPDAPTANWVDRLAPEGLKPWLKLGRFDRPIGTWLLLLPGWQGIALALAAERRAPGLYELWLVLAFALGAALMRAAGCAWNDIVDRDIDAKVARTAGRPIPSGRLSVAQALGFIVACCLASFTILLTLNLTAVVLGAASLLLVAAYPFMKRITWWPQAWLGLTFNWGALLGFAAASGAGATLLGQGGAWAGVALPALLLYAGGIFWTLGYDTLYALQDLEDDALAGVKSSARRLGRHAARGVGAFYALSVPLAAAAGFAAGLGPLFASALVAYAAHLWWQAATARVDDPALALKLFKSNREAGLILLAAIILGVWSPWS